MHKRIRLSNYLLSWVGFARISQIAGNKDLWQGVHLSSEPNVLDSTYHIKWLWTLRLCSHILGEGQPFGKWKRNGFKFWMELESVLYVVPFSTGWWNFYHLSLTYVKDPETLHLFPDIRIEKFILSTLYLYYGWFHHRSSIPMHNYNTFLMTTNPSFRYASGWDKLRLVSIHLPGSRIKEDCFVYID